MDTLLFSIISLSNCLTCSLNVFCSCIKKIFDSSIQWKIKHVFLMRNLDITRILFLASPQLALAPRGRQGSRHSSRLSWSSRLSSFRVSLFDMCWLTAAATSFPFSLFCSTFKIIFASFSLLLPHFLFLKHLSLFFHLTSYNIYIAYSFLWAIPCSAQGLLRALCSGIVPGRALGII